MKLHLLNRSSIENTSITVSHHRYSNFLKIWHYHEELELVCIIQSSGIRFVGDNIEKFDVGELVLVGENVPHMWLNDDLYFEKQSNLIAEAISIHFKSDFLGTEFFEKPEMNQIGHLFNLASQGIKFIDIDDAIIKKIKQLQSLDSTSRVIRVIEILNLLTHKKYNLLCSKGFVNTFLETENKRLNKIYEYVFKNFTTPIGSGEIADAIGMNKSAFSRFFRKTHRKSFTKYLNEIRIGYACKLLLGSNESITSTAYSCGFNNISNFNRQFKLIKGKSPTSYLRQHKIKTCK